MDLLRHSAWLRVLTMALLALGSTAVGAQPHGPSAELSAGASSDGTASEAGLSLVVTANAVGLVDAAEPGAERGAGAAPTSPRGPARAAPGRRSTAQPRTVSRTERALRHRLCVYRL